MERELWDRNELYDLVWSRPMTDLAKEQRKPGSLIILVAFGVNEDGSKQVISFEVDLGRHSMCALLMRKRKLAHKMRQVHIARRFHCCLFCAI